MHSVVILERPWREPVTTLTAVADRPWTVGFLSSGDAAGWSYVAADPDATLILARDDPQNAFAAVAEIAGPTAAGAADGPPFQGGIAGLLSYELGERIERLGLARHDGWPDVACGRYPAVLAFDHARQRTLAIGRGDSEDAARGEAARAAAWLELAPASSRAPGGALEADDPQIYEAQVAEVVRRIAAGEIFQANIARRWRGRLAPDAHPIDVLRALALASPAPFAAYLRLQDRALVSNSPERFLRVRRDERGLVAETEPIKGTAPRGRDRAEDARLAAWLAASDKDRAENLMIVDLMRNDLARVCTPGSVAAPELFRLASFANVHHLVSRVTGRLAAGAGALELLQAAFPPGSITGAPKVQAMKVIGALEGARGPFFGSMFWLGSDGALDSNVLIRTTGFVEDAQGWRLEARAGAGVVADSDPCRERRETDAKIAAIAAAVGGR